MKLEVFSVSNSGIVDDNHYGYTLSNCKFMDVCQWPLNNG